MLGLDVLGDAPMAALSTSDLDPGLDTIDFSADAAPSAWDFDPNYRILD